MKSGLKVVGLGGSLAKRSNSLAALKIALDGAAEAGAQTELLDLRQLALPIYDPEATQPPAHVLEMCQTIHLADGLIWSSPMYHGTVSGLFKNAIDWLQLLSNSNPPYLTDKVVGLISTGGGAQGLQAVNTMEFVVRSLRGWAVPLVMPIAHAWKVFDEKGVPVETQLKQQLRALGLEVARASRQFALEPPTTKEAARAESEMDPLNDQEAKSA